MLLLLFGGAAPSQTVTPSGIASAEAFGTTVVAEVKTVVTVGIPSEEDFVGNEFGGPIGGEAFGGGVVQDGITVSLYADIVPVGIASDEVFGSANIASQIVASSIDSAEAFGTTKVNLTLHLTGVASTEAFGTAVVVSELDTTGIPSAEAFGSHQINLIIHTSGISSEEDLTDPVVVVGSAIHVDAIASTEAFGSTEVVYVITPDGVASGEAVGEAQLVFGAITVLPSGIPTAETVSTGISLFGNTVWVETNQAITVIELMQTINTVSPVQTIVAEDTSSQTDADETLRVKELVL